MRFSDFVKPFVLLLVLVAFPICAISSNFCKSNMPDSLTLLYQSLYLKNQAKKKISEGDTKSAVSMLIESLPQNLDNPERPLVKESLNLLYDLHYNGDTEMGSIFEFGENYYSNMAVFSHDCSHFALVYGTDVVLWNIPDKQIKATIKNYQEVRSVALSYSADTVFMGSRDGNISTYCISENKLTNLNIKHPGYLYYMNVSRDGENLVTCGDTLAQIWNLNTLTNVGDPLEDVFYAVFSPKGNEILAISHNGRIRTVDLEYNDVDYKDEFSPAYRAAYSSCGNYIAILHDRIQRWVEIWDLRTNEQVARRSTNTFSSALSFSSNDSLIYYIASGELRTSSGLPKVFHMKHSNPGQQVVNILDVKISPCGNYIATAGNEHTARLWYASNGKPVSQPLLHREKAVRFVEFSPCGKYLATLPDRSNKVYFWNAYTGEEFHYNVSIPYGLFTSIKFTPDGNYLLTSSNDSSVTLWNFRTGEKVLVIQHPKPVVSADISSNGRYIVSASSDRFVRVWEIARQKGSFSAALAATIQHSGRFRHFKNAIFSPDNTKIASFSNDSTAKILDIASGKQLGMDMKHNNQIFGVAFNNRSDKIATVSSDSTAIVWDIHTGEKVTGPLKHKGYAGEAVFMNDDNYLAVASWDGNVVIWDLATGEQALPNLMHDRRASDIALSPDGKFIVSGSLDRSARRWDIIEPDDLIARYKGYCDFNLPLSEDRNLIKSQYLTLEAEFALASKDTSKAISLLVEALPCSYAAPEWQYDKKALDMLVRLHYEKDYKGISIGGDKILNAKYTPNGKYIVSLSSNDSLFVKDADTFETVKRLHIKLSGVKPINMEISPCSRFAGVIVSDTIRVVNILDGTEFPDMIHPNAFKLGFNNKGNMLVSYPYIYSSNASKEGSTVKLWNLKYGKLISESAKFVTPFKHVSFSGDGKYLIITSPGTSAKIFSTGSDMRQVYSIPPPEYISNGEISADNRYILTSYNNEVRISDLKDGYLAYEPLIFESGVKIARFSPDGSYFAVSHSDTNSGKACISFYETPTGKHVYKTINLDYFPYDIIWGRGKLEILVNGDYFQIWDIGSGKPVSAPIMYFGIPSLRKGSDELLLYNMLETKVFNLKSYQEILDYYH